ETQCNEKSATCGCDPWPEAKPPVLTRRLAHLKNSGASSPSPRLSLFSRRIDRFSQLTRMRRIDAKLRAFYRVKVAYAGPVAKDVIECYQTFEGVNKLRRFQVIHPCGELVSADDPATQADRLENADLAAIEVNLAHEGLCAADDGCRDHDRFFVRRWSTEFRSD